MKFDQYSCLAILWKKFRFSTKTSKTNSKFDKKLFAIRAR